MRTDYIGPRSGRGPEGTGDQKLLKLLKGAGQKLKFLLLLQVVAKRRGSWQDDRRTIGRWWTLTLRRHCSGSEVAALNGEIACKVGLSASAGNWALVRRAGSHGHGAPAGRRRKGEVIGVPKAGGR